MEMHAQTGIPRHQNVGPGERGVSLVSGLGMIAYVLLRRPRLGIPMGMYAAYMVYRGASGHCVTYDLLDIKRGEEQGHEGVLVERAVTINRPRAELYEMWRHLENLPRFMQHLESVHRDSVDIKRSHWVAQGPAGRQVEWDSELTEERQNELLAWRSLPGSVVESQGRVEFMDAPGQRGTVVKVSMQYNPPAGSMGAAVAKLFGQEPGAQIREDLRNLKEMLETGEIATVEGQTSGRAKRIPVHTPWELEELRSA